MKNGRPNGERADPMEGETMSSPFHIAVAMETNSEPVVSDLSGWEAVDVHDRLGVGEREFAGTPSEAHGSWLGLSYLLSRTRSLERTRVTLVAASRSALPDRLEVLDATAAVQLVAWDGTVGDAAFARRLASLGETLRAPVVFELGTDLFGVRHNAHVGAIPDLGRRLQAHASWNAIRQSDSARWLIPTLGRWLAERPDAEAGVAPEDLTRSRATWLLAVGVARSVAARGHAESAAGFDTLARHDLREWLGADAPSGVPLVDTRLTQERAAELVSCGVSPLVPVAGGQAAFPFATNLFRPRGDGLTLEGSLAFHVALGRVAGYLDEHLAEIRAHLGDTDSTDQVAALLREGLPRCLANEPPAVEVDVSSDAEARVLSIAIGTDLRLHDKDVQFEFSLPWEQS